nr:putative cyclin-D6-1 isoform X2 [Arachis hypogaea]
MEFDLEDPLSCFKEQQAYTITELFASESDHMPAPNYLNSTHFRASFRCEAISLILQMEKPWLLKLVVISCLSLASKMKNTPLSISDIQIEGCIFESQTVRKMELLILGALEWRMRSITPFPFLHFFISSTELKDPSLKQVLKEQATKIIFNAHNDIKLLEYKPSTIAASALISASRELCPQQYTMLRASIAACENLDEDSLTKCIDLMQEMVMWTEANESTIDTSFLSTETPVSVLERSIKRRRI